MALLNDCAVWDLCVNCGEGCSLPVARRHLTENWRPLGTGLFICGRNLAPTFRSFGPLFCGNEDLRL